MKKIKNAAVMIAASLILIVSFTNFNKIKIDTTTHKSVIIGKQEWMSENLHVSAFKNGVVINEAKTDAEWDLAGINQSPAWCYYNYDAENGKKYGKLYNWYAVNSKNGLAPKGWHVAKEKEWNVLIEYLGGSSNAGKKLKSTTGWTLSEGLEKYGNGSNESGFNAQPGGQAYSGAYIHRGGTGFWGIGEIGLWWAADGFKDTGNAIMFSMSNYTYEVKQENYQMNRGCSVRCIKN
ncbi:MAG: fibrobacter succinogenes major paralogous domain-containing protein [Bacteroidota bacterium]|nr:fibrobacter succinogenes major paralogous domain-containing protein [Bacteroidota bacterium]